MFSADNAPHEPQQWEERRGRGVFQHLQGEAPGCSGLEAHSCPACACQNVDYGCDSHEEPGLTVPTQTAIKIEKKPVGNLGIMHNL